MGKHKIYGVKNNLGVVVYVGKTKKSLSERYYQHCTDSKYHEKMDYFNDPENGCEIFELYSTDYEYEIPEWEQYYINEFKSDRTTFFNKIRAKRMTDVEKYCYAKVLKKQNNTIDGTFETDSDDDLQDFLGNI
tara:strand:- start:2926 stop:3324 length:399 start_codon:yes stop_codon:yes gene_type:complete